MKFAFMTAGLATVLGQDPISFDPALLLTNDMTAEQETEALLIVRCLIHALGCDDGYGVPCPENPIYEFGVVAAEKSK